MDFLQHILLSFQVHRFLEKQHIIWKISVAEISKRRMENALVRIK